MLININAEFCVIQLLFVTFLLKIIWEQRTRKNCFPMLKTYDLLLVSQTLYIIFLEVEEDEIFINVKKPPKRACQLPVRVKNHQNAEVSSSCVSIDAEETEEQPQGIRTESYKSLIKKIHPQYPQRLYAKICSTNDMEV